MPKKSMLTQIIPNVQDAFVTVFHETETMLANRTTAELNDLAHLASETPATEPFSRRLAAETVKHTCEKILKDRKASK
jgi:hypothetical protein